MLRAAVLAVVLLPGLLLCLLAAGPAAAQSGNGVRTPAFAPDGRLAVSIAGDLWVLEPDGAGGWTGAIQVTHGPAWDRDPAWLPDGSGLVFASDRAGSVDLWRADLAHVSQAAGSVEPVPAATGTSEAVPAATANVELVRITTTPDHDVEPSVSLTGAIVFVRGHGGDTDLWVRSADGAERRLTDEPGAEREPAWSPDGESIAYVAVREGRRELRILRDGETISLLPDRFARAPVWSPDGARIAFDAAGPNAGLWVVHADGTYPQAVTEARGVAAWSPDGASLVIAEADAGDGGYNGDPDRLGERRAGDVFRVAGGLQRVTAPAPLAAAQPVRLAAVDSPAAAASARSARNAAAYDRVWSRVGRLYYELLEGPAAPQRVPEAGVTSTSAKPTMLERWAGIGRRHRGAALSAADGAALEDAIWAALRERPVREAARGRAGVSSAHPLATAAGVEVLELGGNVVDAAVAVSFALGVVEPDASGVGGYGQMLIQLPGMEEPTSIEFLTRVPESATLGNPAVDAIPRSGPGVANVPGTVAGMELAWRRYGSGLVEWARLLEPAIRLAERGHVVDDAFATTLRRERERFSAHESSRALFFPEGRPLAAGDTLRNADLAWTLRQIAEGGAAAFYTGSVAERMVDDLARGGNLMTAADLRRYFAVERQPLRTTYRGHDVFSGPPPVTGGAVLLGRLNLLERVPAGGRMTEDAATLHAMIEATKLQPSTTGRVADPDLWPVDVTPFESKDTAAVRWRCFDPTRASEPNALSLEACGRTDTTDATIDTDDVVGADVVTRANAVIDVEECLAHDRGCTGTGTTAFVVADADGGIVSVTQTLGTWGGNFHVTPGLGFLYNDKLRSYGSNPDGYNARLPYARNTTIISPTIVFRGSGAARRPWFGVGAAGNAWITAAVYNTVTGIIDHDLGAQQALELPRFLSGGRGIQVEDGFAPAVLRQLEAMGHSIERISLMGELRMGYGAAVIVGDGVVEAAGDPRRSGAGGATGGGNP